MPEVVLLTRHPDLDPTFNRLPVLHHDSSAELLRDAQRLQVHAQNLLTAYGCERPLELLLIPLQPDHREFTAINRQVSGRWNYDDMGRYQVALMWGNTDLNQAIRVLTHEVGHHLRGPREVNLGKRYQITESLLHEGIAERLVLEQHGLAAMHHNTSCDSFVCKYLPNWLERERDGTPLDTSDYYEAQEADLLEGFLEGGEMYPPATRLMLMSGLGVEELMNITPPDYLDLILPYAKDLK